jgi:RHS repeat-associated protein
MDMNGDALPDIVVSRPAVPHSIYLSRMDEEGVHTFDSPYDSAVAASSGFQLSSNLIQELDYNGDGFADLVNHIGGSVLLNKGGGDWEGAPLAIAPTAGVDAADLDDSDTVTAREGELQNIRYFDYDGDRLIDILKSTGVNTTVLQSLGDGAYTAAAGVENIGADFASDSDNLELADMNGDGLLDPVRIVAAGISYKRNLGRGRWDADWRFVGNSPVMNDAELPNTSLEDLNGDGIDDVVYVGATQLRYALNRNGDSFEAVQTIDTVGGAPLPLRDGSTSVLFADMNANGSNDVVWVDGDGNVTYLELFPVRPNLLSYVENGIGMVTEVTYGTAAKERARDQGVGWDYPVPSPMVVVDSIDTWALRPNAADEIHDVTTFEYRGGYYDGAERQWHGFEWVTTNRDGDDNQDASVISSRYDVGVPDGVPPVLAHGEPWNDRAPFAGTLLEQQIEGDAGPFARALARYAECDVDGVPTAGLDFPIQWVCTTESIQILQEARPPAEWVEKLVTRQFDGWGNLVRETQHGVTSIGGAGCGECTLPDGVYGAPCGAQCLGDELVAEMSWVLPPNNDGRWLFGLPVEERQYAEAGGRAAVTRIFYDGEAFVGLPAGEATHGLPTRVTTVVDADTTLDAARRKFDAHGNMVESIGPNGDIEGGHRELLEYSADGLNVLAERRDVTGPDGAYQLVREFTWEPLFGEVASSTRWSRAGAAAGALSEMAYDEHGRLVARIEPGGSAANPTEEHSFELGAPTSRVVVRARSSAGGPADVESVRCLDGLGRTLHSRTKIEEGRWLVSGDRVFNRRGKPIRDHVTYESDTGACVDDRPAGLPAQEYFYDAMAREVRVVRPDGDAPGGASERWVEFAPLATTVYSEDDTDTDSPHFDTPGTLRYDGLGRLIAAERLATPDGAPDVFGVTYDDLSLVRGLVDPLGNERVQRRDQLGRIVELTDADAGRLTFEYDAAGNLVRQTDAAGRVVRRSYDELSRKVEEWDEADREGTLAELFYDEHPDCGAMECGNGAGLTVGSRYQTPDLGEVVDAIGYDERGRPTFTRRTVRGKSFLSEMRLDNIGRLIGETFPDGREVEYTLDGGARVVAIPGFVDSIEHNERGFVSRYVLANGTVSELDVDERGETTGMRTTSGGAAVIELEIERNRVGNVTRVTDGASPAGFVGHDATISYDALGRMLSAALGDETIELGYDGADRILTKTSSESTSPAHIGDYRYDGNGPHAVTDAGGRAWGYDAAGYATERGADSFEWTHTGRLQSVARAGREVSRWTYDGSGSVLAQREGDALKLRMSPSFEIRDGVGRVIIRLDGRPIVEDESAAIASFMYPDDDGDGAITAADAWAQRSTTELKEMLRSSARRMVVEAGGDRSYLHNDHLGSTIAVTDADGEVRERLAYFPNGAVRDATAGQTEYGMYAGAAHDSTGLLLFRERTLAPEEGRWLSVDPGLLVVDDASLEVIVESFAGYAYAGNNPMSLVDHSGTMSWKDGATLGTAIVFGAASLALMAVAVGPGIVGEAFVAGWGGFVGAASGAFVAGVTEAKAQSVKYNKKVDSMSHLEAVQATVLAGALVFRSMVVGAATGFVAGAAGALTRIDVGATVTINSLRIASSGAVDIAEANGGVTWKKRGARVGLAVLGGAASLAVAYAAAVPVTALFAATLFSGAGYQILKEAAGAFASTELGGRLIADARALPGAAWSAVRKPDRWKRFKAWGSQKLSRKPPAAPPKPGGSSFGEVGGPTAVPAALRRRSTVGSK